MCFIFNFSFSFSSFTKSIFVLICKSLVIAARFSLQALFIFIFLYGNCYSLCTQLNHANTLHSKISFIVDSLSVFEEFSQFSFFSSKQNDLLIFMFKNSKLHSFLIPLHKNGKAFPSHEFPLTQQLDMFHTMSDHQMNLNLRGKIA